MSDLIAANSAAPAPSDTAAQSLPVVTAVAWADPVREALFAGWLQAVADKHGLLPASVRLASADASFRRYLRVDDSQGGTRIIMDAPPAQENCTPFVHVGRLMEAAGLKVLGREDVRPHHGKVQDREDPLHIARSAEVTSLWRLAKAG